MNNTKDKELMAMSKIKQYNVFNILFPENEGFKIVKNKREQLMGLDYIIYLPDGEYGIDLKSLIGPCYESESVDYREPTHVVANTPAIVIEIEQYTKGHGWRFTNHENKATDGVLYYVKDNKREYFMLVDYKEIMDLSYEHKKTLIKDESTGYYKYQENGRFVQYTSFNNTGKYIRVPIKELKSAKLFEIWENK